LAEVDRLARAYTGELSGIELLDRKGIERCAGCGLPDWEAAGLPVESQCFWGKRVPPFEISGRLHRGVASLSDDVRLTDLLSGLPLVSAMPSGGW